jgi:N utilization substance protein B
MAARSKARKRAVDLIYEADLRGDNLLATLAERVQLGDPPINDYTVELVKGVTERRHEIDDMLTDYSEGWTLERMPGVDRAILRVGLFELLWAADIPDAVAIDEAVELAKTLSTDDSPKFINGILGRVLRDQIPADGAASVEPPPVP